MKEYIFGCILISFIGGIALHVSHTSLTEPTRIAIGIVTLLFVASPFLYLFGSMGELKLPNLTPAVEWGSGEFERAGEEAFLEGVRSALSDRYGTDADSFIVSCDGFDVKRLSAERLSVTLVGKGALLDYRAIKEYLENDLDIGECRVNVEVG